MSYLDDLGVSQEAYQNAEAAEVRPAFEVLASGIYGATIEELATFSTDSGAGMFKATIQLDTEDKRKITMYNNIVKKDGKPNEIGVRQFKAIISATNVDEATLTAKAEDIKAYAKTVTAKVLNGLKDKKMLAFVRAVHEEGASFEDYNEIETFGKVDGTNAKGEDMRETFTEKIGKDPVLQRKAKVQAGGASTQASAVTADNKDINDVL